MLLSTLDLTKFTIFIKACLGGETSRTKVDFEQTWSSARIYDRFHEHFPECAEKTRKAMQYLINWKPIFYKIYKYYTENLHIFSETAIKNGMLLLLIFLLKVSHIRENQFIQMIDFFARHVLITPEVSFDSYFNLLN